MKTHKLTPTACTNPGSHPAPASGVLLGALVQRLPPPTGAGLPEGYNVHLFPSGRFASRDGRPSNVKGAKCKDWLVDAAVAARLIAAAEARQTPLVLDYEHQSLTASKSAGGVPAAGWIERLAFFEGRGLFAFVRWTERASAFIAADEYRYISPAFLFNYSTGEITELVNAALTNTPALDGLDPVAAAILCGRAAAKSTEEHTMNKELLAALCALLGLKTDATEADVQVALVAAQKMLPPGCTTMQGLVELAAKVKSAAAESPAAGDGDPDPATHVPLAAVAGLQDKIAELTTQIATLTAQTRQGDIDRQIDAAMADGRLDKALEPWARELAKNNPTALSAYISTRQPLAALTGKLQSGSTPPPDGSVSLSAEDKYVIEQLGIDPKAYAALKEDK